MENTVDFDSSDAEPSRPVTREFEVEHYGLVTRQFGVEHQTA
jgi:hypothetical protein